MNLYPATVHLRKEHQKISNALEEGLQFCKKFNESEAIPIDQLKALLFFLIKFVESHHQKEEKILFPYLQALPQLSGGPHCTYYSGLRLMRDSVEDQVKKINHLLGLEENDGIPRIVEGNPLNPILEEHLLGHKLAAVMKFHLEKFQESHQTKDLSDFFRCFIQYSSLLQEHIVKENDCLFYMVDHCLSSNDQLKILQDFEQIDYSTSTDIMKKLE